MSRLDIFKGILDGTKAVIFDFDNVLVDSEPFHYRAYSRIFGSRGHRLDRDEYWLEWTSKGGGAEGEISRHGLAFNPAMIRAEKDPVYSSYCRSGEIPFFPAALKLIDSFHAHGHILAIASGSYGRDIRALLSRAGIEDRFRVVIGKDGIEKTKPHPETYLRAIAALGLGAAECFAVEDAEKGVAAAHEAGMKVVTIETEVTRGFDLGASDLHLSGLDELHSMMIEAGLEP